MTRTVFLLSVIFFFNDTATTEIYTLSLHDALPIWGLCHCGGARECLAHSRQVRLQLAARRGLVQSARPDLECGERSEEHTSELQSQSNLVCRLLLEKKKK